MRRSLRRSALPDQRTRNPRMHAHGGTEAEARNFSQVELLDKKSRYARADEFLQVAAKLWDSWEDDALVLDPQTPVFADASKVHPIDHHGDWFDIDGPLNVPRPPQGYPVILQAGASPSGRDMAARWADAIFCSHASLESAQAFYSDIKERAKAAGRDPDDIKVLPSITPIVRPVEQDAKDLAAELYELVPEEAGLSQLSYHLDIDLSQFPLDEQLPALDDPSIDGHYHEVAEITRREGISLRQLGKQYGGRTEGNMIGTPSQIADGLEKWFSKGAADGFTVGAVYQPGAFEEFVREVVPELQRRGLYRTAYEGTTLRDSLGVPRPAVGDWQRRGQGQS
ncbi:NtaA/DmoA family FMN-dependent monooxygenase [Parenemella sanctibonifatiensis]|uniref:NtaA/DmoA family FMN-dependent monooxygenase n=1 Tax=Parenemella sanctibonifatiensis TaxID=2016505 RepID=UPI001E5316A9|nr:NtaA/DmoA family FMN-dependent monooxygenase [Parenemella sanctibonifatiensis]